MQANPSQRLRADQVLLVDLEDEDALDELREPVGAGGAGSTVLYEDEDVLVVDKPAGLAVEPERWDPGLRPNLSGALH